jgi:hypothetical protein
MTRRITGARDLIFDVVEVVTDLVETTHSEVSERWTGRVRLAPPLEKTADVVDAAQRSVAAVACGSIRLTNHG